MRSIWRSLRSRSSRRSGSAISGGSFRRRIASAPWPTLASTWISCRTITRCLRKRATVRGLHFQVEPFVQDNLVRVSRGAIRDVAVDVRRGSPTFGRHVSAVISADEWNQILVPVGFAHGFVTLEPDTEVLYKATGFYSPEHNRGIIWNDPDLGIDWGIEEADAVLSEKDVALPTLKEVTDLFTYGD